MRPLLMTTFCFLLMLTPSFSAQELWSADRHYGPGDEVLDPQSPSGEILICLDFPMSDFCSIAPEEIGGRAGWATKQDL